VLTLANGTLMARRRVISSVGHASGYPRVRRDGKGLPGVGRSEPCGSPWILFSYMCRVQCVRMTAPLERVLGAFLADPAAPRYGYDLMKAARLPSGTLYPLLARLEHQKLVASAWETPQREGQRPRRYYRLTGEGIRIARLELAQASSRGRRAPARAGRPAPGSLG
jgi:PadR family transcriptional regulator PadR